MAADTEDIYTHQIIAKKDLLGMEEATSQRFEELLAEDSRLDRTHLRRYREYSQREIIRPGFTRINLPYFLSEEELEFVLKAVKLVAEHGWKLLPEYMFNPETGEWRQRNFQVFKDRKWLGHISYNSGEMAYKVPLPVVKGPLPTDYKDCLQKARDLFTQASKKKYQVADNTIMFDDESKSLRWFLLPSEAESCLHGNHSENALQLPFCPPSLRQQIGLPAMLENHDEVDDSDNITDTFRDSRWKTVKGLGENVVDENGVTESGSQEMSFSDGMQNCLEKGFIKNEKNRSVVSSDDGPNDKNSRNKSGNGSQESGKTIDRNTLQENSGVLKGEVIKTDCDQTLVIASEGKLETFKEVDSVRTTEHAFEEIKDNVRDNEPKSEPHKTTDIEKDISDIKNSSTDLRASKSEVNDKTSSEVCEKRKCLDSTDCCPSTCLLEGRKRHAEGDATEGLKKRAKDEKVTNSANDALTGGKEKKKKKENKWFSPPKTIFAPFLKAMEEFSMLQDGDKVLVCLSGGKDSLSLLHTMRQYQFYCRKKNVKFDLGAVTVDPETTSYDPSPLKPYLACLGVPYFYESQCILEQASNLPYECASICSFCSRMKRGRIYACARREGYNVLALGQHLDDLCESFLMSVFHNGILRTMKAHYTVEEGDLRVIRPLVYTREKDLRMFAEKNHLPVISENCPGCFEAPKERHRVKQLLAAQEIMFPRIFPSMMSAIKPIMAINKTQTKLADLLSQGNSTEQDDMDI